jgi:ATP-dependent DNA helicase RecG
VLQLDDPLRKALPPSTAKPLADRLDLHTVGDLMAHLPRKYEQGGQPTDLAELVEGEHVLIQATVHRVSSAPLRSNRKITKVDMLVTDGRKNYLAVTFFTKGGWREQQHPPGSLIWLDGTIGSWREKLQLTNPTVPTVKTQWLLTAPVVPIYPSSHKLSSLAIATATRTVLDQLGELDDPLPESIRTRERLPSLRQAYEWVHRPTDDKQGWRGQRRLRWDEALVLQVALAQRRAATEALPAVARPSRAGGVREAFERRLPFTLTDGQAAVTETLLDEIARPHPMHRLLEGEVGSGKTVVALLAMLAVIDAGGQAALLAPTEVLATQHHRSLRELLGPLGRLGELESAEVADLATQVVLLTGSSSSAARREALKAIGDGTGGIVVGTHALLEESVAFHDLGLVVVDEQHRFGVEQRDALRGRGAIPPHVLVMTATPIPRTVAMTVFGDLETSSLTELPKGRQPITTHVVPDDKPAWVQRMWGRIADEVSAGHQAYVVCPRIDDEPEEGNRADDGAGRRADTVEDGDGLDDLFEDEGEPGLTRRPLAAVVSTLPKLRELLPELRIEALHGRLPADEKDAVMTAFGRGDVDVLVATTVIEVGVDVPNATVMAILDADRFGISQLHQLRGRVGRGSAASFCLLHTQAAEGSKAFERVTTVAKTQDGAELARADLDARREGDVLGAAQSGGRRRLRLLQLRRDTDLIVTARADAIAIVEEDPELTEHPALARVLAAELDEDSASFLEKG